MATNKTVETGLSVDNYVKQIKDANRRKDFSELIDIFKKQSGFDPKMWGSAIVGFGTYHYKYESGREGDAPLCGLSSRANAISLYLSSNFDQRDELLAKFGKHKSAKACIYIQNLDDIDKTVLAKMVKNSITLVKKLYPEKSKK
jgi:hypothetical protein